MPTKVKGTTGVDKVEAGAVITNPAFSGNATVSGSLTVGGVNVFSGPYRNLLINGDMRIDQRNAGASVTPTNAQYHIDRWRAYLSQASKYTVQQSTTAPSGFNYSLLATSSSAYTVGASDYFLLAQPIEGLNSAHLAWGTSAAKTVTLSFWVRSSLTGTFGGAVGNAAGNRSYPYSYTISSANTWERKTITIAGDTSGTWVTTNASSVVIYWSLGSGSSSSGTAGAWSGTYYDSVTGATSIVGTSGATFYITGVQLEVGEGASDFEFLPYDVELARCQRYYEKSYDIGTVPGTLTDNVVGGSGEAVSTTSIESAVYYKVPKRISGNTVTIYAYDGTSGTVSVYDSAGNSGATPAFANKIGEFGYMGVKKSGGTNFTAGAYYWWQWTSSAEL